MQKELSFQVPGWSCPLRCDRCEHVRANGLRCKNRVCYGSPVCWIHNKEKYGIISRQSTIPAAGKGLFATRLFQRNRWVCPYIGESIATECSDQRYPGAMTAPYAAAAPNNVVVDSACRRGIAASANGRFNVNGTVASLSRHNCIIRHRPVGDGIPGLWLKTTKRIQPGREIFVWYGAGGYQLDDNHSTRRRESVPDSRPC